MDIMNFAWQQALAIWFLLIVYCHTCKAILIFEYLFSSAGPNFQRIEKLAAIDRIYICLLLYLNTFTSPMCQNGEKNKIKSQ